MEYLPFGETLVDEHNNSHNTPFKFNGKEFDEETGNYYYSARYYDPKMSIFISVDRLAEEYPSISSYAYVANNPINAIDPDGNRIIFVVYHKKGRPSTYTYQNGNFYDNKGKIYNPEKGGTMYKVLDSYRKIEASDDSTLKGMLKTLETSEQNHWVSDGPKNQVTPDPNTMSVKETREKVTNGNPVDTRTTHNFSDEEMSRLEESIGVPETPLSIVSHELKHVYDYDQGCMADSVDIDSSAKDPAEIRAVNIENRARKIEDLSKRTKYGGEEIDPNKLE
ncbi:RHS repeat-associated core domain-containing protein [Flavobacterium litorale]|uniref:RHS repeat-associated core domain-containing protein n=1 Tax=Flavobacterium litorale TaxID=2856519 RepID=A0ABX8V6X3_9FLAO|nr:RHS repeat-associated core domain-containing protein [Flavobacterium litorale]QYJ68237.1 RHS repeat-associated core domain-containing protein [Flavobacterium litorale]